MSWASKSSLTATWTTSPSKLKFQQEIRSYVKAKHKHLLHDASFLMMTFPLKMSLQGLKDEMNQFYCCVCQGKHSQAKTLKTTSLGNIEKAGMVRINIKYWTKYWTSKLIQVCFYFLWQVPELIEEYSQSLEDIMASQVPGGESGKQSEIENKVRNLI